MKAQLALAGGVALLLALEGSVPPLALAVGLAAATMGVAAYAGDRYRRRMTGVIVALLALVVLVLARSLA